jgi:hypothetical protein
MAASTIDDIDMFHHKKIWNSYDWLNDLGNIDEHATLQYIKCITSAHLTYKKQTNKVDFNQ